VSKINLLPWREELRIVRNRIFYAILIVSAAACGGLVVLISIVLDRRVEVQTANVEYIDKELLSVKGEISEIKGLQENKKQLLERMAVIGSLQTDRYTIVKLLDLFPRILPAGVYLTEVSRKEVGPNTTNSDATQSNNNNEQNIVPENTSTPFTKKYIVVVKGVALTNGSISNLLKNLGGVKWVSGVKLNEVGINAKEKDRNYDPEKEKEKNVEGLNFQLEFTQLVTAGQ